MSIASNMHLTLPDFGDLLLCVALLFGVLIALFETMERRREGLAQQRLLDLIAQEYSDLRRLGHF